jgi:hypothetical protein
VSRQFVNSCDSSTREREKNLPLYDWKILYSWHFVENGMVVVPLGAHKPKLHYLNDIETDCLIVRQSVSHFETVLTFTYFYYLASMLILR